MPPTNAQLVGSYAHPAYGNCTISEAPGGSTLQISGCATVWNTHNLEPWIAGTAVLRHLYYSTYAVIGGAHLDVGAGDPTVMFASTTGDGVFDRFESRLEDRTTPIVFTEAGGSTPLATKNLLENTDGVGAPHRCSLGVATHRCSLGKAICFLLIMLTRAVLMPSLFPRLRCTVGKGWGTATAHLPNRSVRVPARTTGRCQR